MPACAHRRGGVCDVQSVYSADQMLWHSWCTCTVASSESQNKGVHVCFVGTQNNINLLHEDFIAAKEVNSLSHYNLVQNLVPIREAMTIPGAKAAFDKELWKLEKLPAWQVTKVKSKEEVIQKAQKEGRTVQVATVLDVCHPKNSELEPKFTEVMLWRTTVPRTLYSRSRDRQHHNWRP